MTKQSSSLILHSDAMASEVRTPPKMTGNDDELILKILFTSHPRLYVMFHHVFIFIFYKYNLMASYIHIYIVGTDEDIGTKDI